MRIVATFVLRSQPARYADVNSTLKLLGTSGDVPFLFDGDGAGLTLDGIQLEVNEEAPVCPGSCEVLMLEEEQTDVDRLSYAFPVFDGMGTNVSDYLFAVGTAANQTNARPFGSIDEDLDEVCNDTMCVVTWDVAASGLTLTPESTYYVSIKASNVYGVESEIISSLTGTSIFEFCPLNLWLDVNVAGPDKCTACPDNMMTDSEGKLKISDCFCRLDFYRLSSDNIENGCKPCPKGGVCVGADVKPYSKV